MNILKSTSLTFLFSLAVTTASATINGDGYYRIHNMQTGRYAYIVDNTGSINVETTTIEAGAIELWPDLSPTLYDPATVLYFEKHGDRWDVLSQATGIYKMLGTYLGIYEDPRNPGTYWAYGTKGSMTAYLWDANASLAEPESWMTNVANNTYPKCRNWYIDPIDNNTDNYFGLKPTIISSQGNYAVWFADLSFSFASSGMTAYYITKYDSERHLAVYKEVSGNVPAQTPVFVKCADTHPSGNKLNLGAQANEINDNILNGVWFNCKKYNHDNRVVNDKATMRVLSVLSDGTVGFKTGSFPVTPQDKKECLPRNSFYLRVPADAPDEIHMVSEAEYEELTRPVEAQSVTLNTTSLTLTEGDSAQLTATVAPANTTDPTVIFTSSNTSVATVDANGKVTAVAPGTATITAKCGNATATCAVTVNKRIIVATGITLTPATLDIYVGESAQLTATVTPANTTDPTVTYTSSNTSVVTVDNSGKVTAVAPGSATITAKCGNVSATCQVTATRKIVNATGITLNYTELDIFTGEEVQLYATVTPDDTTDPTVTFSSSNTAVATVNATGKVVAVAPGNTTITARCGNVTATCAVSVSQRVVEPTSITLDQTSMALKVGESGKLNATVLPDDTTDPNVIFESSNIKIATVNPAGYITALQEGTVTITARCGAVTATCEVSVTKHEQTITWDQDFTGAKEGDEIVLTATASSGNDVIYEITEGDDIAVVIDGFILKILAGGTITIKATSPSTAKYEAAEPITKTIDAISGINDASVSTVKVLATADGIFVIGAKADTPIDIYSLDGAHVYSGTDRTISLRRHTAYIVKIASKTVKIAIR